MEIVECSHAIVVFFKENETTNFIPYTYLELLKEKLLMQNVYLDTNKEIINHFLEVHTKMVVGKNGGIKLRTGGIRKFKRPPYYDVLLKAVKQTDYDIKLRENAQNNIFNKVQNDIDTI